MQEMEGGRTALLERDAAIRASVAPAAELAARYGLSPSRVGRIRAQKPPEPSRRERFELEVLAGTWRAACMDAEEWSDWVRSNPTTISDRSFADRPCLDCPLAFATEMRAHGRCNGTPGNARGAS